MGKPLAVDLYCGLGGWTEGLLAEGYDVIGFDIERHEYGEHRYPAQLVLQDVLTINGAQFRDAALIVASPPCQAYSYRAMPWSKAKALPPPDNSLFEACFRIQQEACAAAGRHIPLVVENVRGAQPWVGRSRWAYGSFHLWGDVPALMPMTSKRKVPGFRFDGSGKSFQSASVKHTKNNGQHEFVGGYEIDPSRPHICQLCELPHPNINPDGRKVGKDWFGGYGGGFGWDCSPMRRNSSKSKARKAASAMIAKIPLPLARYIAAVYKTARA